jgi:hypothetical protein
MYHNRSERRGGSRLNDSPSRGLVIILACSNIVSHDIELFTAGACTPNAGLPDVNARYRRCAACQQHYNLLYAFLNQEKSGPLSR